MAWRGVKLKEKPDVSALVQSHHTRLNHWITSSLKNDNNQAYYSFNSKNKQGKHKTFRILWYPQSLSNYVKLATDLIIMLTSNQLVGELTSIAQKENN